MQQQRQELCVIGDRVQMQHNGDGSGSIVQIYPRDRALSRVEPGGFSGTQAERQQVIVANLDQTIFVFAAANPAPHPRMLDRFLVVAEKAEIPSIHIAVNKVDLITPEAVHHIFDPYARIGYAVHYVSAQSGEGLTELADLLHDQLSVLTGPSGVGKSSLLNQIQPDLGRAVGRVSEATTKGRHTTVYSELIPVAGGGYVADTPGIRSIAPWDVEPTELDAYFIEFKPYIPHCRYKDCMHSDEPGCALRAAVEAGQVSRARYESYLKLQAELNELYIY